MFNFRRKTSSPASRSAAVNAARDKFDDARTLLGDLDNPVIVDGGAAGGATIRRMRRVFPRATFHAFEVLPARLEQLHRKFDGDPRVHLHAQALSDAGGELTFHVTANGDSSSALTPGEVSRNRHGDAVAVTQRLTVPRVRLDDAVPGPVDLIKLDLQGYELHALRGAQVLLGQARLVLCEVEFIELYDEQPLFGEVAAHLRRQGFRLHNLYDLWTLENGQLTSGDALFVNERPL